LCPPPARRIVERMFERAYGHLEALKAPVPVWIDLTAVYRTEGRRVVVFPDGVDLQETVPGLVRMWGRATTGQRIAWVTFAMTSAGRTAKVGQWVLEDAIRPRAEEPTSRELRESLAMPVIRREQHDA
jgi:hypothetical protein